MKKLIFLTLLAVFENCTTHQKKQIQLPNQFKNIEVKWHKDGGMVYYYEDIKIANDSSSYKIVDDGNLIKDISFKTPLNELYNFYKELKKINLSKIESKREEVYDRGGTNLSIQVDTLWLYYSNSGQSFIVKGKSEYHKIESLIFDFIEKNKEN